MRFCSIASGSSGNCIYVGSDNTHVLVDIGISGKKMETGLNSLELTGRDLDGILITHEHSDHIKGLGSQENTAFQSMLPPEPWMPWCVPMHLERFQRGFFMKFRKTNHL